MSSKTNNIESTTISSKIDRKDNMESSVKASFITNENVSVNRVKINGDVVKQENSSTSSTEDNTYSSKELLHQVGPINDEMSSCVSYSQVNNIENLSTNDQISYTGRSCSIIFNTATYGKMMFWRMAAVNANRLTMDSSQAPRNEGVNVLLDVLNGQQDFSDQYESTKLRAMNIWFFCRGFSK